MWEKKVPKAFVDALLKVVQQYQILQEPDVLRAYASDAYILEQYSPQLVLIPDNEEQIQKIVRICQAYKVPVVARGAGTGLSGGATPHPDGIVLSLAKLNHIQTIDPLLGLAVVQPGVRNQAISDAARAFGLYYAPDPSSQLACTIGGNVAENAGGIHCLKYGLTYHNIYSLRLVTMEGDIVVLGGEAIDAAGLDLLSLVIGSEGMLGIITEVTVKLVPLPENVQVILATFPHLEQAALAVEKIIAAGIVPSGLELMDQRVIRMVERYLQAGYDTDAEAILLCESDGLSEDVALEVQRMTDILQTCGASACQVSSSAVERDKLWAARKSAFPATALVAPDYYCMDGTIPRQSLAAVIRDIVQLAEKANLICANVFHAGDGNLHPMILFDAQDAEQQVRAEQLGADILELCVAYGGTITGEHGVGLEKINQMCVQFSDQERQMMFEVKAAFDPDHLLNRGKVIPTLHRCAEYGKMHVHHGKLKFPELPRF